ncbi:hypothetical protein [Lewinella cohaerens]|uniref:hypothetical protein n=1 Tax=Lewinella cohaerens TaxID=70995 RepID=UPI000375DD99|nr:hypothetical protein [Lewinella cohaerens]
MEFQNNQKKSLRIAIGLFILIMIITTLLIGPVTKVLCYIVFPLVMAAAMFRMHSGKRVRAFSLNEDHIIALLYEKPFTLKERTFPLGALKWFWSEELVGEFQIAKKLVGKSIDHSTVIMFSEEQNLWNRDQMKKIAIALQEKGATVKGFHPFKP